jgi:cysteine-rich repeat protein
MSRYLGASWLALTAFLLSGSAFAFTDLTNGKMLRTADKDSPRSDKASFRWSQDPALLAIPQSPLCPAASSVRLITNLGVLPEIALDCAKWAIAGVGFRYRDKDPLTGRSISMKLSAGKLSASVKGPPYANAPVVGPVSFVETRVTIGSAVLCGRWSAPPGEIKRNQAAKVQIKGPTAACQVVCGNSIAEDGEECDDGNPVNGDGCDDNCTVTACGNSIQTSGEGCDDGNTMGGDGCRANCTVEACGDGITDPLEDCDDSNTVGGDCCSATCDYETAGSPCTSDSNPCTNDVCNGSGVCQHPNNTAPCNDLDGCTITDTCAGGTCQGTLRAPWFNEIDYDDFFGVLDDRDEFVEIAGPAGADLSNFQLVHVEGGLPGCLTPHYAPQAAIGEPHFVTTIPPGTVLQDDTGTGIGFYVACFPSTSLNVVNLPACDDILPAPRLDSNLLNGHLVNASCSSIPMTTMSMRSAGRASSPASAPTARSSTSSHPTAHRVMKAGWTASRSRRPRAPSSEPCWRASGSTRRKTLAASARGTGQPRRPDARCSCGRPAWRTPSRAWNAAPPALRSSTCRRGVCSSSVDYLPRAILSISN